MYLGHDDDPQLTPLQVGILGFLGIFISGFFIVSIIVAICNA